MIDAGFFWSGGKDSAQALGKLLLDPKYNVRLLLTTVQGEDLKSSVHEVPLELLERQARAIGIPLETVELVGDGLGDYAYKMQETAKRLVEQAISAIGFGDLEHSNGLEYREKLFGQCGLEVIEPLWGMTPTECVDDFLAANIDAITVVVQKDSLDKEQLGKRLTRDFFDSLPATCDPCGEYGEYHTFVANSPYFQEPVEFSTGEPSYFEREIGTSDGTRKYGYWILPLTAENS